MPPSMRFAPIVCVVGFHHARGPEIESWFGVPSGTDPAVDNDWSFLPFMALSDGAHTTTEDFSYFTLRRHETPSHSASSVFGISCTRQLESKDLLHRPEDVTRSTVQKSVVVIAENPGSFGAIREKLLSVTRAWFMQKDFTDVEILKEFQESLLHGMEGEEERDQYLGLSLREFIHDFKYQTLVLFKCCLLQPKMLFFGSRCERLCMMQFALISLIPGLLRRLEDCADPDLDSYEKNITMPISLKTSERNSLLSYMGLPLQIFGKGSLFGPYTPLQQLDILADYGTKSYIVGSTNSLLLQQKDRYSDILINLDETIISITSTSLRQALALSAADRRWIDFLAVTVAQTWDPSHPNRPTTHGYLGSEEFIRLQFEEYVLALLAATKYHKYLYAVPTHKRSLTAFSDIEGDPSMDFNENFIEAWKATGNFKLWDHCTEDHLFDIVEPRHPTAGGLSIEDINRRLNQQIQDLHLDERLAVSRDVVNRHLEAGQKKVTSAFNHLWADIETLREAHRKRFNERQAGTIANDGGDALITGMTPTTPAFSAPGSAALLSPSTFAVDSPQSVPSTPARGFDAASLRARAPDLSQAQAAVGAAGVKAGAYLSSWGSWVGEKRRNWAKTSEDGKGNRVDEFSSKNDPVEKPVSPRKIARKKGGKEEVGGDGIGRLDA